MTDLIVAQEQDVEIPLFEQLEDEPVDWYNRFMDYYVALGNARTLRAAYLLHNEILEQQAIQAPSYDKWREYARLFNWKKRAAAHDHAMDVYAKQKVAEASQRLQEASVKAVEALEDSLQDPRSRVAASKAILDRAGLGPVKEVKHSVDGFSADELAQAAEEIDAWENQMSESSG